MRPSSQSRRKRWPLLAGLAASAAMALVASVAAETVGDAVARIEAAFRSSDASRLRPVLPAEGKVQISLPSFAGRSGYFSASQCEYLLRDIFRRHPVSSFRGEPPRTEAGDRVALRARLTAGSGERSRSAVLHLLLSHEDGRWLLREIREHSGE